MNLYVAGIFDTQWHFAYIFQVSLLHLADITEKGVTFQVINYFFG